MPRLICGYTKNDVMRGLNPGCVRTLLISADEIGRPPDKRRATTSTASTQRSGYRPGGRCVALWPFSETGTTASAMPGIDVEKTLL